MSRDDRPEIAFIYGTHPPQLEGLLRERYHLHPLTPGKNLARDAAAIGGNVRALVTTTLIGATVEEINAFPNLEVIICTGGHIDRIDQAAAKVRGIPITNTPNTSAPDVADMALTLMLAVARQLIPARNFIESGGWKKGAMPYGHRVSHRRLGIIGMGFIGRTFARRAEGLEMDIAYHGRAPKPDLPYTYYDDPLKLAADVDYLSLHCSVTPETQGMVDSRMLEALGPEGFLINTARGEVVDQSALIQALKNGTIAGAGLDVYVDEPNVPPELLEMPNVVVQPHHGAFTVEGKVIVVDMALDNLAAHFAGKPLVTPVDLDRH